MIKQHAEPVTTTSAGINEERLAQLRQLFPEAFTEGKIDFDKLRQTLGDFVDDSPERYTFTWAGRRDAIRMLQTPTSATLVPAREESISFDDTSHVFIEGENLEVLKLLYKAYFGKVKMIYIDPPYNTGKDLIYPDNYADPLGPYLQLTGQKDELGQLLTSNPESSGRFHSNWLSMIYPRLFVARQLLTEDGVIFVSINDRELSHLQILMNEIFGEENFFATVIVQSNKRGQTYKQISRTHEYLVIYTKADDVEINELEKTDENDDLNLEDKIGKYNVRELRNRNPKFGRFNRPNLFYQIHVNPNIVDQDGFSPVSIEKIEGYSVIVYPLNSEGNESCWRWMKSKVAKNSHADTMQSDIVARKKTSGEYGIYEKYRKTTYKAKSIWFENDVIYEKGTVELGKLGLADEFDFPKPVFLLKKALMLGTDGGETVLDFFAGSATLAQAVFELNREDAGNRKAILVQLPERTKSQKYESLARTGIERCRRVIALMTKERQGKLNLLPSEDLGLRVFKLTTSHFKAWLGSPGTDAITYQGQLTLFRDPLVEGWQAEPVVWEISLKEGYPLHSRLTQANVAGHTVYRVENPDTGQQFHITLEASVTADLPRHLNLTPDDLFVCRDLALNDTTAANLALQCRLKTI